MSLPTMDLPTGRDAADYDIELAYARQLANEMLAGADKERICLRCVFIYSTYAVS